MYRHVAHLVFKLGNVINCKDTGHVVRFRSEVPREKLSKGVKTTIRMEF